MRYIDIRTLGPNSFQVWACRDGTNTVVMAHRDTGKLDFNRQAVGLRVKKGYHPPTDTPGVFTRAEAIQIADQIGRVLFKRKDPVYSFTSVDGLNNPRFFVEGLNRSLGLGK